jgi:Ribbon-helix-helix protein, copG family
MGNFQDNAKLERLFFSARVIIEIYSDNMIRTQVSLDEKEYILAKKEARALGISVAEYVRRALREALRPTSDGPWMRYGGLVESGDRRSSQSIDAIVYGTKD